MRIADAFNGLSVQAKCIQCQYLLKVRGEGALPPHTSGAAFDLARKHMPAEEQNFVMQTLARMEREGKLDALIEYGVNACFHIFIYHDRSPPRM